ncbi:cleavage stimulating factor 64-like [Apium graveolens]|uniref:cleavage stimulating factor 64-like n=1 Tax=Apium graveolens TaxID=4045 RepID=UPI003D795385
MAELPQLAGVELSESIAGMSKNQLYEIMSQMKALIEQNQKQARHILITNPSLTRALFQAQIMLGMVQPAEAQSTVQEASTIAGQVGVQDQTNATEAQNPPNMQQKQNMLPVPSPSVPSLSVQSHPQPLHPVPLWQPPVEHVSAEATAVSLPQPPQVHNLRPTIHSAAHQAQTQSQQPLHTSGISHMQHQPPLQPKQQSPFAPAFGHQAHPQMGRNEGLPHFGAPRMHHARPMFHSGYQHPVTTGPLFSQGHPTPTHQPTPYQGGSPHMRMEINRVQADKGSPWTTGLRGTTGTQFLPGIPQYGGGQIGPGSHPRRPQSLSPDMEAAILQQVMSLTPEQINLLPAEQRNQVLQLQMMLRQ